MNNGFSKGLLIGSIIGVSLSMMAGPNMMRNMSRRRIMKTGRNFLRKAGRFAGQVVEIFR